MPDMTKKKALPSISKILLLFAILLFVDRPGKAQTDTAILQGVVVDPQGAVLPQATVTITNNATSNSRTSQSNASGSFAFVGLLPGTYSLRAEHPGFQALSLPDVVLNVGGRNQVTLHLIVGSVGETVTVEAGQSPLETTDVGVSNVVSQQEIKNMPLNGRSFQDLIQLSPGVTSNSPQSTKQAGQLSVNGQANTSNNFILDGVSVNASAGNNGGFTNLGAAGAVPVGTVVGTTQSIVPVDDLQEFRVETSSYTAEYGSGQGGQIIFASRSGTNQFHGGAFDYLRNTAFDANDWFNNYYSVSKQPLHQNDFGGFIGGPVWIPKLYDGRGKTFFFADDESLRLSQPVAATIGYVPNAALRAQTSGPIQLVMNAFPTPNGPDLSGGNPATTPGLGEYISGYSSSNHFDSYNLRLDQVFPHGEEFFVRASNTPSGQSGTGLAQLNGNMQDTRSYTVGLTSAINPHITNELRANFTNNSGTQSGNVQQQGGAQPINLLTTSGYPSNQATYDIGFDVYFPVGGFYFADYRGINSTRQFEVSDALSLTHGDHQFKFGGDFRRLTTTNLPESPLVTPSFYSPATLIANTIDYGYVYTYASSYPQYLQYALYAEDNWRVNPRLTVSYGLRWDINPAPTARRGASPLGLVNQDNLSQIALSPVGAPIYNTYYGDFGPRIGVTYMVNQTPGYETQLRAGTGLFYDTGTNNTDALAGYVGPGFSSGETFCPYSYCIQAGNFSFPVPQQFRNPPIQFPPVAPYTTTAYGFPKNFAPPYSIQGNVTLQQNFGASNALTLAYVTSLGRKGVADNEYYVHPINPNFQYVYLAHNALRSQYNSGQIVFQHRVTNGLFAYAAYTWAHSTAQNQFNLFAPYVHGTASGDLRNNFNAMVTWDIAFHSQNTIERTLLAGWGTDFRLAIRGGFPITLTGLNTPSPLLGGANATTGVNYVPGVPVYLYGTYQGKNIPGGKMLNPAAFVTAAAGSPGEVPVNYYRGFGENQINLALRRDFPLYRETHLQFRADAFNVLNHSQFGAIDAYLPDVTFGQATNTLANALGGSGGGLASQYQAGGPRSLQLALKLLF